MWQTLIPKNSEDQYTALLTVDEAKKLDTGHFTCQIIDWGLQQCKSLFLEIIVPPDVEVKPMSATIEKVLFPTYLLCIYIYVTF